MHTKIEMRRVLLAKVIVNCADFLITLAREAVLSDHEKEGRRDSDFATEMLRAVTSGLCR
jgi:hypothetical protein